MKTFNVDTPNGIVKVQAPENATDEEIINIAKSQETPKIPKQLGRGYQQITPAIKAGATVAAGLQAPAMPVAGLLQLAGINRPAEALRATSEELKGIAGFPAAAAETVGEALPTMLMPGGTLARFAAQGAVGGMGQPTPPQDSYADMLFKKAQQGVEGGIVGGALGKVAQAALAPRVSPELAQLQNLGMTRFTPGQLLSDVPIIGQGLRNLEQSASSLPLSGAMVMRGLQSVNEDFNRAMANQVLRPLNERVPQTVQPGREMAEYVDDVIGRGYDDLAQRIDFRNVIDPATGRDTIGRLTDAAIQASRNTKLANQQTIFDELNRHLFSTLQARGRLSGQEFRDAERSLGSLAKNYIANPLERDVGFALRDMQSALRNELANQNPAAGADLRRLHNAFRRYLNIERAGGYVGAEQGVYSPLQLLSAIRAVGGPRSFARGQNIMQAPAESGVAVMGRRMPDSGTAGRLQAGSLMGTGIEGGAQYLSHLAGYTGAPLAITASLYNSPAMRTMTTLATQRPAALRALADPASRGAAGLGGASISELNP